VGGRVGGGGGGGGWGGGRGGGGGGGAVQELMLKGERGLISTSQEPEDNKVSPY